MNRKLISSALNEISDEYILEASRYGPENIGDTSERIIPMDKKTVRRTSKRFTIIAVAACLVLALGVTALATGLFSIRGRSAEPDDHYTFHYGEAGEDFIEWKDFKYVFEFEGPEECGGIRFKPGWLPFAPNDEMNAWARDEDGWYTRLVSEGTEQITDYLYDFQPYCVEVYYAPQFLNGGALLLFDQMPDKITEERWGEEQVLKFTATQHRDANDYAPEYNNDFSFVIRFHPEEGYILVISGTSDMDTIEHVARELEIEKTDEVIRSSDFENNCTFIDVSQG